MMMLISVAVCKHTNYKLSSICQIVTFNKSVEKHGFHNEITTKNMNMSGVGITIFNVDTTACQGGVEAKLFLSPPPPPSLA